MTRRADIGSKRLVSLAPTAWARWLTGDATVVAEEMLSSEFQWVSRSNDVLLRVHSAAEGRFLLANEIQIRPDRRIARRINAYAALAEERFDLRVYPVVVNILPPFSVTAFPTSYHADLLGLTAHRDFRTINLWEVDVDLVFDQELTTLLPFVPILRGGGDPAILNQAVIRLRADERLDELEPLLAFFATFVLDTEVVRQIMRWDMTVLRESPWYQEILQQGIEQGKEREATEMVLRILRRRFGAVDNALLAQIEVLSVDQLHRTADVALDATELDEVRTFLADLHGSPDGEEPSA